MGNQGNKVHITFNRKLPVYTFNAPHNIEFRPLPINHRPISINMQCNKIPFIAIAISMQ